MTDLYRFYDTDDQLLYVGITDRGPRRWREHMAHKPWWSDVARIDLEHIEGRRAAERAERQAIITEQPLHNIVHARAKSTSRSDPSTPSWVNAHTCWPEQRGRFSDRQPFLARDLKRLGVPIDDGWNALVSHYQHRELPHLTLDTIANAYWQYLLDVYPLRYLDVHPFLAVTDGCHHSPCDDAGCYCTHSPIQVPECGSPRPYIFHCHCCGSTWKCWFGDQCYDPEINALEMWTRREDNCALRQGAAPHLTDLHANLTHQTPENSRPDLSSTQGFTHLHANLHGGHAPPHSSTLSVTPQNGHLTGVTHRRDPKAEHGE